MALTLKINGVDKSNAVLWRSLNWSQALTSQVDTLTFQVQKYGSLTFAPEVLDEVELYEDAVKVFGGNIVTINENVASVDRQVYSIAVKDYQHLMDRRVVVEKYTDEPVINIINEILNRYVNKDYRIEIASFEPTEIWVDDGVADTDHYRVGTQGRKLTSASGSTEDANRYLYQNLQPTGFSADDFIEFEVYVDDKDNLNECIVYFGDESLTNYFYYDYQSQVTTNGWNLCRVAKSSFSEVGSPDWTNIRRNRIRITSVGSTTVNATFDNMQVLTGDAFTRNGAYNATQNINFMAFNYEYPSKCFQRMAELFAWHWYVDENKDIKFFAKFDIGSAYNLTDTGGNYVYRSLKINSNADQLRNAIYVRGGDYIGTTITEDLSHQADGTNKIFKLGYKYSGYALEVNSTPVPVGIENLDAYTDNLGSRQVLEGGTALKVGDVAGNTYQAQQVIVGKGGRRGAVKLRIRKVGTPADSVSVTIYSDSSDQPSGVPLSAPSLIAGGSITTAFQEYTFSLTEAVINDLFFNPDDKYHIVVDRSGGLDASNYYEIDVSDNADYDGYAHTGNATPTWTRLEKKLYFVESIDYDVLYSFQEKIITFASAPAAIDVIEWTADPYYPIFVLYRENVSISAYGEYQYAIIDKSIKTRDGARQRALEEVLAWAEEVNEAQFTTYISGLRAGQTINIQSAKRGLNQDYVIQRVIARARTPETLEYTVVCVTTRTYGILYWLQSQIMKDNRDIEIADNEQEDKIEALYESMYFTTEYTYTKYTGKKWGITGTDDLVWDGSALDIWI